MKTEKVKKHTTDYDIEQLVGRLLRVGVITASCIVFIGGLIYLIKMGADPMPSYAQFKGESAGFTTFEGIFSGLLSGHAKGIVQFGVLVLIATPIMRIILSLIGFTLEKDKLYIVITLIVLCVMLVSTLGGFAG
ncbi:DUF1634 domain-containing protein [Pedobacter sp. BMA]|uniref:DUF1634 domain-containing protein n=1 Tax=Pedobacter sp. BMA TaxID=1663685 RepID=UPI00064A618B|nr:DUF1634 domain-containing protein [Pedobacter sp. BMA]KLT63842.1 membrane protein [Pedobacter sp. BMA]